MAWLVVGVVFGPLLQAIVVRDLEGWEFGRDGCARSRQEFCVAGSSSGFAEYLGGLKERG